MQAEQAQLSYKKAGRGGGRAAVQQELCRHTHTGNQGRQAPLHWDPEPQRNWKVSGEGKKKRLNRRKNCCEIRGADGRCVCGQGCLVGWGVRITLQGHWFKWLTLSGVSARTPPWQLWHLTDNYHTVCKNILLLEPRNLLWNPTALQTHKARPNDHALTPIRRTSSRALLQPVASTSELSGLLIAAGAHWARRWGGKTSTAATAPKIISLHPFTNMMETLPLLWRQTIPPLKGQ